MLLSNQGYIGDRHLISHANSLGSFYVDTDYDVYDAW